MTTLIRISLVLCVIITVFYSCRLLEEPVSKEEAITFAKALEKSIEEKDPTIFNQIFDVHAFTERVALVSDGKISKSDLSLIPENLQKRKLGAELLQMNGKDGTYQLVKHYEKDKAQHLLFRIYGDGGINYHDIELVRTGEKIKAADMYVYMSGENFSKSIADILAELKAYYKTNPDAQKSGTATILSIRKLMRAEKYTEAKEQFELLPEKFKNQKSFQLIHIMIASKLDNEMYKEVLQHFAKSFPNEPNVPLMMLDHHILQNDYQAALADINQLDSTINKDPFLDFYRGNIYNTLNDTANAIRHYERLVKNLPSFADGYIELAALYLNNEDEAKARHLLTRYRQNKKFNQEGLEIFDLLYPDFGQTGQK